MEIYCTRPSCPRPVNHFTDLDDSTTLRTVPEKYCMTCGMRLILDNRYLPIKLLGRGGFGAAFLARDRRRPGLPFCVVKQFQPAGHLTADQLQIAQRLFEREAEVLETLGKQHPQIPDLLAFFPLDAPGRTPGQSEQFFYLVQEFVDGQDMEAELAQKGKFSEAEVLDILRELLKILQFVHDNGSIHRDIKPSNIMRRRDGVLFLLDFGAVKQQMSTAAAPAGRSTGIYSMGYAPPEQMQGGQVYPSTDLYALAVTCVMFLTGKPPNELYDPYSNTWNWRSYAQVSDRLAAVLNRMLLPSPSQRFASANEVLAALTTPAPAAPTPAPAPTRPSGATSGTPSGVIPGATPAPMQPSPSAGGRPFKPQSRAAFSLWEVLGSAAFTGFEGGLLAIAIASLLGTSALAPGFWLILLGVLGGMIFAQSRRWIEKVDLAIIAVISLLLVQFLPFLHRVVLLPPLAALAQSLGISSPIPVILLVAGVSCLLAIAATALFRLIYNLLSRFL
ncbi:MAG: protein kinase [Synechococcales cyanobacterium C42_A2020_086]|nr:protein kinase [Synechococcales cyanobacterium C42_A2020_086]